MSTIDEFLREIPPLKNKENIPNRLPAEALEVEIKRRGSSLAAKGRGIDFTRKGVGIKIGESDIEPYENVHVTIRVKNRPDLVLKSLPGQVRYKREWGKAQRIGVKFDYSKVLWRNKQVVETAISIESHLDEQIKASRLLPIKLKISAG